MNTGHHPKFPPLLVRDCLDSHISPSSSPGLGSSNLNSHCSCCKSKPYLAPNLLNSAVQHSFPLKATERNNTLNPHQPATFPFLCLISSNLLLISFVIFNLILFIYPGGRSLSFHPFNQCYWRQRDRGEDLI